jgi:hypothetical protein
MPARSERRADRWSRPAAWVYGGCAVYGVWLLVSYAVLIGTDRRYLWHLPLYGIALLLLWRPDLIRPRRPASRAGPVHHILVGTAYGAFLCHPLATLGAGDLYPDVLVNSALWSGSYLAFHATWAWLLRRRRWKALEIVAVAGTLGLADPSLLLARSALAGDWQTLLLFMPVLHAVFAASLAPPVCAYRAVSSTKSPQKVTLPVVLALVVPNFAYRVGLAAAFGILYTLRLGS